MALKSTWTSPQGGDWFWSLSSLSGRVGPHRVSKLSPLRYTYSSTPVSVVLSSLNCAKGERKINVLKYVDRYISMSFLNSQSKPGLRPAISEVVKQGKMTEKAPNLFPLPTSHTWCLHSGLSPLILRLCLPVPYQVTRSLPFTPL